MGRPVGRRGESRARVVSAASRLFGRHGVAGTSLQMIADELGVTKAAVYHQFNSKADIVLAAAAPGLEGMERLLVAAEARLTPRDRFETTLDGLVDLALDHRDFAASLRRDPALYELLRTREPFQGFSRRLDRLLIGDHPEPAARVALAAAGGGLMIAGVDPSLTDIDRVTVRRVLFDTARAALAPYAATAP